MALISWVRIIPDHFKSQELHLDSKPSSSWLAPPEEISVSPEPSSEPETEPEPENIPIEEEIVTSSVAIDLAVHVSSTSTASPRLIDDLIDDITTTSPSEGEAAEEETKP